MADPYASLHAAELPVILWMQQIEGLAPLMKAVSNLGPGQYMSALLFFIFLAVRPSLGIRLALAGLIGVWLREILALTMQSPRPFFLFPEVRTFSGPEGLRLGYSLPSGHAFLGSMFWFILAAEVRRPWAWAAAGLIAGGIGVSRVYLGVHFPSDVLLGLALGLGGAVLQARWSIPLMKGWQELSPARRRGVAVAIGTAMLCIGIGLQTAFAGLPAAARWIDEFGVRDRLSKTSERAAGGVMGLGLAFATLRGTDRLEGAWWRRLVGFGALAVLTKYGFQPAGDWVVKAWAPLRFPVTAAQCYVMWRLMPLLLSRFQAPARPSCCTTPTVERTLLRQ